MKVVKYLNMRNGYDQQCHHHKVDGKHHVVKSCKGMWSEWSKLSREEAVFLMCFQVEEYAQTNVYRKHEMSPSTILDSAKKYIYRLLRTPIRLEGQAIMEI